MTQRIALGFFRVVRAMRVGRTPRCRYLPTCSAYALEAVELHGPGRGTWLAIKRVGRCHPFGSHGFDPVPKIGEEIRPAESERADV